jgi:hypothetical protein
MCNVMMKKKEAKQTLIALIVACSFLCCPTWSFSHGGRTDSSGGHYNRGTGEYHYHNGGRPSKSSVALSVLLQGKETSQYNRKDWPHWVDTDNDCQNTRAEILIRDSVRPVKFKRNKGCNVTWGEWLCPYTGKTFTKASDVDIDHIAPLSHAHRNGGADWSREKKRDFANDPINLIVTEDSINQAKGDKAPNEWKPPNRGYWKEYASQWRAVKAKYGLVIGGAEEQALRAMGRSVGANNGYEDIALIPVDQKY